MLIIRKKINFVYFQTNTSAKVQFFLHICKTLMKKIKNKGEQGLLSLTICVIRKLLLYLCTNSIVCFAIADDK